MNEQLIVKNFGPIKDATVDFKRVTVFIGPTGGGKSTLAKLAAVFREKDYLFGLKPKAQFDLFESFLSNYTISKFRNNKSHFEWKDKNVFYSVNGKIFHINDSLLNQLDISLTHAFSELDTLQTDDINIFNPTKQIDFIEQFYSSENWGSKTFRFRFAEILSKFFTSPVYIPSERIFASSIEGAAFGLRRAQVAIPYSLEEFLSLFEIARKNHNVFELPLFGVKYNYTNGRNILVIEKKKSIELQEGASGIQTTLPLMLVVEDLSRYIDKHSFIVEEPELNLYPTAQQQLLNWLVKKCTESENDLTITTHSPYILSHLNLLLYAHQVAEQHPERADEVAELVPRESWINPKEFACYQVENGGVTSLVNEDLGLIDDNGLDGLSGDAADAFDNLIRLSKGVALK